MYPYNLCYYAVAASNIIIAHPGQDVELSCSLGETSGSIRWLVDHNGPYGVNSLRGGILDGYSAHADSTSIIIQNIMMNDSRNGTEYQCETTRNTMIQPSDTVYLLYVAGEFQHIRRWISLIL